MRKPIFIRTISAEERRAIEAGLHSPARFTVRRSQIMLASERGERVPRIAAFLGCDEQTVRNALVAFNARGQAALVPGSRRPKTSNAIFTDERAEQLKALLHRSPREFGKATSLWTLDLAAEVSFAEGLTPRLVSGDCIRLALKRLKVSWQRAKHWITSPDPDYAQKKSDATS
jgi:transposase